MLGNQGHETSMAAAFQAAGYELPRDRLRRIMAAAVRAGKGLSEPSIDRFVATMVEEDDAALERELVAEFRMQAIRKLFTEVLGDVRAGKMPEEAPRLAPLKLLEPPMERRAASMPMPAATEETVAETTRAMKSTPFLSPSSLPVARPEQRYAPPGGGVNGMLRSMGWQRDCWLRRIEINKKSVADLTFRELEDGIKATDERARFLKYVMDAWPKHTTAGKVSDYLSPEDGDILYERARNTQDV